MTPEHTAEYERLTADLILGARAAGLTPGRMGSTSQWRMIVKALLAIGWTPPAHPDGGRDA